MVNDELKKVIDNAVAEKCPIITTVEAFHKEPELLYEFLQTAANLDVEVVMASIKTTDKTFTTPRKLNKEKE